MDTQDAEKIKSEEQDTPEVKEVSAPNGRETQADGDDLSEEEPKKEKPAVVEERSGLIQFLSLIHI